MSTIFRRLSHKLSPELLLFVERYSEDIVSRNILTLRILLPLVIVTVVMVAVDWVLERSQLVQLYPIAVDSSSSSGNSAVASFFQQWEILLAVGTVRLTVGMP
ncbi:hypothetical protein Tco_0487968 [Tanacetum coccineum]